MKIIETAIYKQQLREISLNIKKDKLSAAITFVKDLKNKINDISNMPKKYRKSYYYDDENVRDMIFKGYTIVYKICEDSINIVEVFNKNLPLAKEN